MQIKIQYFWSNEKELKLFILFLPDFLIPYGIPHELHINLPDNALSALKLELPQTKHLFARILNKFKLKNYQGMIMVSS